MNLKNILKPLTALVLFLLTSGCLVGFSNGNSVVIDAGHGGEDNGAVSGDYLEKEWNLDTSRACANELVKYGVYVYETRTDDTYVSLEERASLANINNVDYFISIHHNSSDGGNGDRGEVIYSIRDEKSKQLASNIEQELKNIGQTNVKTYTRTNGYGTDYYSVLRNTRMSAIIIEVCFIDNPEDRQIADTKEERERNGIAIAHGILRQLGINVDEPIIEDTTNGTNIMSKPTASYEQLYKWAVDNGASDTYLENLQYIWDKSIENGVNPILVATQCALETDYMRSYIFKTHNNTSGMKASSNTYKKFDTIHDGIDAQIQHLMVYAGAIKTDSWLNGWCTTVEGLAGRWAEDPQYSNKILSMMDKVKYTQVDSEEIKTNNDKQDEINEIIEENKENNSNRNNLLYDILNKNGNKEENNSSNLLKEILEKNKNKEYNNSSIFYDVLINSQNKNNDNVKRLKELLENQKNNK